ncbi:hypothetical protein HDU97_007246 [Phlyctochytrium planicorne]|nr:hypothetical protein HDU97_007246 [Phlyctochytrium planicorne]
MSFYKRKERKLRQDRIAAAQAAAQLAIEEGRPVQPTDKNGFPILPEGVIRVPEDPDDANRTDFMGNPVGRYILQA